MDPYHYDPDHDPDYVDRDAAAQWRDRLLSEEEVDCVMRTSIGAPWAAPINPRILRVRDGLSTGTTRRIAPRATRLSNSATQFNRRLADGFAALGAATDDGSDQVVRKRRHGDDAAIATDQLATGGWMKVGNTNAPCGKPRTGIAGAVLAERLAMALPGASVEEIGAAVRRGKHRLAHQRILVDRLAAFIAAYEPERHPFADKPQFAQQQAKGFRNPVASGINHQALADTLGVSKRVIDKLAKEGRTMTAEDALVHADALEDAARSLRWFAAAASDNARPVRCIDGFVRPKFQCRQLPGGGWEYIGQQDNVVDIDARGRLRRAA